MTYFYILGPLYICGMGKATDFKFGMRIQRQACHPKNAKLGQKGRGLRHVTYFYNFETASISLESIKLETSNLACGLKATHVTQKMQNWVKSDVAYVT